MTAGTACATYGTRKPSHHVPSPLSFLRQRSISSSNASVKIGAPPTFRSPKQQNDHDTVSVSSKSSTLSLSRRNSSISSNQSSPYKRPSVVTSTTIDRKKNKISYDENCCFCEEPLLNVFDGETLLDMSCGHHCHFQCYSELFDSPGSGKSKVYCPICGTSNTFNDDEINDNIIRNRLLTSTSCEFNQDIFASTPATLANQLITPLAPTQVHLTPLTPVAQTFPEFRCPSPRTQPLFLESPVISTFPSRISAKQSDSRFSLGSLAEAKVEVVPEFSKIILLNEHTIPKYYDLSCVMNIKSLDYEPSLLNLPEKEKERELKSKEIITKELIHNFESKLPMHIDLDVANLGFLVLFDIFECVTVKGTRYERAHVYFFDQRLVVLNSVGDELIQNVYLVDKLSSVFENESSLDITLNLASLSVPEVELTSDNKLIHDKWMKMLSKFVVRMQRQARSNRENPFVAQDPFSDAEFTPFNLFSKDLISFSKEVPLIQMSTNAWGLLTRNEKVIPNEVLKYSRLVSKGLDLPMGFLKRQISKPDSNPLVLILVVPIVNNSTTCLDDAEYTAEIRQLITEVLEDLQPEDKLGIVLQGNKRPDSQLGNYYGCMSPLWEGWRQIISTIECYTPVDGDEVLDENYSSWQDGLKYVQLLSTTSFSSSDTSVHEIVFINTERLKNEHYFDQTATADQLWGHASRKTRKPVPEIISQLCDQHNVTFHSVSLFDEYTYHPQEVLQHYHALLGTGNHQPRGCVEQHLALDLDNLHALLKRLVSRFHDVSISNLQTRLDVCKGVTITEFENQGQLEPVDYGNSVKVLDLHNVYSSFEKSVMMKVRIDLSSLSVRDLRQGVKLDLMKSTTKLKLYSGTKQMHDVTSIKLSLNDSGADTTTLPLNLLVTNPGLYETQFSVPIHPRLSAMKDAVFVKRQTELLIIGTLVNEVFIKKTYSHSEKEEVRASLKSMVNKVWELVKSCNSTNTSNVKGLEQWSEALNDEFQEIIEGYTMRNYYLSNSRCLAKYFQLVLS
ncbi:hypothetical protein OGAPHI_003890 [Ogataea philodendri]|uniref:RING-type domain-containing protein n=1 Tax=Ogataea philodendri TaxID=1378263 RepID=A0A9P8P5P2_9ASCO|nr:uncharacterized protein OGAPHI_003890 [Ogataea philodendri]KAH3665702.1 hypothetical protein OGAPHI_003890 [Ogataea philodendri]